MNAGGKDLEDHSLLITAQPRQGDLRKLWVLDDEACQAQGEILRYEARIPSACIDETLVQRVSIAQQQAQALQVLKAGSLVKRAESRRDHLAQSVHGDRNSGQPRFPGSLQYGRGFGGQAQ